MNNSDHLSLGYIFVVEVGIRWMDGKFFKGQSTFLDNFSAVVISIPHMLICFPFDFKSMD